MNRKQKKKLLAVLSVLIVLGAATALVLYALKQNINLFYTPTQLLQAQTYADQHFRIGGYVKKKSVVYDASGTTVRFTITDQTHELSVSYHGVLPNLFREGQGVVVTGMLIDRQHFLANEVLAKHDEKYIPYPLAKELQTQTRQTS